MRSKVSISIFFMLFYGFLLMGALNPAYSADQAKINLNTASIEQLQELKGIGPSLAQRIITYRQEHPFQSCAEIMQVKGIGESTFEKIKERITVE